jgi:hypothetical protein
MAGAGVLAGAAFGFVAARLAGSYFLDMKMPGAFPVVFSAFVLLIAAVVASCLPTDPRGARRRHSGTSCRVKCTRHPRVSLQNGFELLRPVREKNQRPYG